MVGRRARDATGAGAGSGSSSSSCGGGAAAAAPVGVDGNELVDVLQAVQRRHSLARGRQVESCDARQLKPLGDLVEEGFPGVAVRDGDGDFSVFVFGGGGGGGGGGWGGLRLFVENLS